MESVKPHLLEIDQYNLFSGWVFFFGKKVVKLINVYECCISSTERGLDPIATAEVNIRRQDIADFVPTIPAAKKCGFEVDVFVGKNIKKLSFDVVFEDGSSELLFEQEMDEIREKSSYFGILRSRLDKINMPDGDLVYLTQGSANVDEYKNSIIPSVMNICDYLSASGVHLNEISSLLDFGCGTGRLLTGWNLIEPQIELFGCDFNMELLGWAENNLPDKICFTKNELIPPLPYRSGQFDLIYLISVFTHLTLETQQVWVNDFKRILKKGGYLLVTLHGELYAINCFYDNDPMLDRFYEKGTECAGEKEGSNQFSSFHTKEYVSQLFDGFECVGYFQNGRINDGRVPFKVSSAQDVYVLRYTDGVNG